MGSLTRKSSIVEHKGLGLESSKFGKSYGDSLKLSNSKSGFLSNNFKMHKATFGANSNANLEEKRKTLKSEKLCRCVNKTSQSIDTSGFKPYYHRKGMLTTGEDEIGSTEHTIVNSGLNKTGEKFFSRTGDKFRVNTATMLMKKKKKIKSANPQRGHQRNLTLGGDRMKIIQDNSNICFQDGFEAFDKKLTVKSGTRKRSGLELEGPKNYKTTLNSFQGIGRTTPFGTLGPPESSDGEMGECLGFFALGGG